MPAHDPHHDPHNRLKAQMDSIKTETAHPSVINDVVNTELEAYPGHIEESVKQQTLTELEQNILKNKTDSKTWNSDRHR